MRVAFLLVLALLLPGCASPASPSTVPPTADRLPTPSATASTNNSTSAVAPDARPEQLKGDENADLRVRIAAHSVNDSTTSLTLDVLDKGAVNLDVRYLYVNAQNGRSFYFEPNARVPPGQERRMEMSDSSGQSGGRDSPWMNLTIYYTVGPGLSDGRDGLVEIDLAGRGYP